MSLVFYVWGEPIFAVVLISSIIFNYYTVKQMAKSKAYRKRYLFLIQGVNIFVLIVFKYISFVSQQCIEVFALDIEPIQISLPIGISFFTFQIMSYVFDVYYDRVPATNKILTLGLYTMMFPQLVAGPIVRYSHICNEIENRTIRSEEIEKGIIRFIIGLAKKVLIADYLAEIADGIFATCGVSEISMTAAWVGAICYTLQIYFDFSGYSDMAIGLGLSFGFHFDENFNYPYISTSITEFWRRWHISLTSWFRDYVYIPLGGESSKCWKAYI